MSVITISRGPFSGGEMLAECLAAQLKYRCVDREVIVERAAANGVSQSELLDALLKPPGFLDRFQHKKYMYMTLIQAALAEEVRTGNVVYHGNAGHLLLKAAPVLRVRVIAPMEFRVALAEERLKLDRDETLAYIRKADHDRRRWTEYLYGVDWEYPGLYDAVLNLERLQVDDACAAVTALGKRRCFQMTAECKAALDDLALASRIRASLAMNASTSDIEVDVSARQGSVSVKGKLSSLEQFAEVQRIAGTVPGVTDLNLDQLEPPNRA